MRDLSDAMKAMRTLKVLFGLALLAAFLYNSRCATAALSTREKEGPIKVFELGERIPRNSKILDITYSWGGGGVGAMGTEYGDWGSYREMVRQLKKKAKAGGGDAIAILYAVKPSPEDPSYEIKAFLLDMIDINDWPRVGLTEEEIRRDSDAGERALDDIEGIWASQVRSEAMMDHAEKVAGYYQHFEREKDRLVWRVLPTAIQAMEQLSPEQQSSFRLAIVKAADDPDFPYAAYILDPDIPEWKPGFLKARLRKLPDSSGYEAKWYGSTFQADLREFHSDETGALTTKVVIEQGLKYSIEQTLTKVYPPQRQP